MMSEIDNLRHTLHKIEEAVYDGQNGSASYAMDRLRLIDKLVIAAHKQLTRLTEGPPSGGEMSVSMEERARQWCKEMRLSPKYNAPKLASLLREVRREALRPTLFREVVEGEKRRGRGEK